MAALVLCSMLPGTAQAAPVTIISMAAGQSTVLHLNGLQRVAVGDKDIAGVVPIGDSQLLINAKGPGRTSVIAWTGHPEVRHMYDVTVTVQGLDVLAQMLRSTINMPGVEVQDFNHAVVVRGSVSDGAHFAAVADILSRFSEFAKAEHYTVVNALQIAHPLGDVQSGLAGIPGSSDIRVDPDGKGNVIVSGRVHDEFARQGVLNRVRGLAGRYLSAQGTIIDRLAADLQSQIDVRVYVMEIDKTALNELGFELQSGTPTQPAVGGGAAQIALGGPSFPFIEQNKNPLRPFSLGPFYRTTVLVPTLNLLMQQGHAELLSAPNLVTMPGNEATFLVGGQIPIPYSTGLGQTSVVYKDFGVKLDITPTLLGNGTVETKVSPEVSDLDFQDGVQMNGFLIPALKTSKLSTDLVTQPGESIIMGGLLRHQEIRNINSIPLLSSLPILGKLFRSTRYQSNQSDVVFVMTPYVVTR
jgi:Flp pilus assembly secretin CpaC